MAIALGAVTAVAWGLSELQMIRVAKAGGALTAALWLSLFGMAGAVALAPLSGAPRGDATDIALSLGPALFVLAATGAYFLALEAGQLSLVSPIVAANGAVTAILAVLLLGESIGLVVAAAVAVSVVGITLAAVEPGQIGGRGVGWALCAAGCYGAYTAALSVAADDIGPLWAVLAARIVMVAVLLPLALARRSVGLPRELRRPMVIGSVFDVIGFSALAIGLEIGPVAIVGVIAAQFATISVVLGATVLGERLRPTQWAGVGLVLISIAVIALAR